MSNDVLIFLRYSKENYRNILPFFYSPKEALELNKLMVPEQTKKKMQLASENFLSLSQNVAMSFFMKNIGKDSPTTKKSISDRLFCAKVLLYPKETLKSSQLALDKKNMDKLSDMSIRLHASIKDTLRGSIESLEDLYGKIDDFGGRMDRNVWGKVGKGGDVAYILPAVVAAAAVVCAVAAVVTAVVQVYNAVHQQQSTTTTTTTTTTGPSQTATETSATEQTAAETSATETSTEQTSTETSATDTSATTDGEATETDTTTEETSDRFDRFINVLNARFTPYTKLRGFEQIESPALQIERAVLRQVVENPAQDISSVVANLRLLKAGKIDVQSVAKVFKKYGLSKETLRIRFSQRIKDLGVTLSGPAISIGTAVHNPESVTNRK
jgi:hypothetical protein